MGIKEGISSWKGYMSNTHESTKHNSQYLLEAEKKFVEIQSIVIWLLYLMKQLAPLSHLKKKIKSTKGKVPIQFFFFLNNLPFIFLQLDPLINHQPRQKSNLYSSVNQL